VSTATTTPSSARVGMGRRRRTGWPHDVVLGIRLAVGGGRTSWARLVLGTIGIGLATAVLLVAASVGHFVGSQYTRTLAAYLNTEAVPGVAPLDFYYGGTRYRDVEVEGSYLHATGPNSPVPPGLARLPGPGEIVVSPALAALLASPDGALLRPRFPQRVIGTISQAGLRGPQDITFYAGLTATQRSDFSDVNEVYSFGRSGSPGTSNAALLVMAIVGGVALLVPILIMVSVSSRIAGVQRDRRLAALRLVGAGSRQVRRIAAAESLVAAATGLVLGGLVFLGFRQLVPLMELDGISAFTSDITPPWPLVVVVVLFIPALAVGAALIALRRTVIEPLGVVRGGKPVRRRLWWRAGLVAFGVGALLLAGHVSAGSPLWTEVVAAGSTALLVGVPVLLPWLLERVVASIRGGAPSWQLAVRRLQLDSGTPARVVGGVAVVLAGAIALQLVLFATSVKVEISSFGAIPTHPGVYDVTGDSAVMGRIGDAMRSTGVVRDFQNSTLVSAATDPAHAEDDSLQVQIASCTAIRAFAEVTDCADGDVFVRPDMGNAIAPNTRLTMVTLPSSGVGPVRTFGTWTLPARLRVVQGDTSTYGPPAELLATPSAIAGVRLPPGSQSSALVTVDPKRTDAVEYLRNAAAAYPISTYVTDPDPSQELNLDQRTFLTIRNFLLAGSLFTLLLAGVSLLVLALEQVRERRRPLAMLSASGVPRAVLARSLLWQTAVPVAIGVVAAVATGIGLAALLLRMTSTGMTIDWAQVGIFSGAAVVLTLLVTAATLPALRNATKLSALRTE
jgi:FtsX-like permease family